MKITNLPFSFIPLILLSFIIKDVHAWEPRVYEPKIGTLDQYVEIYYAILKREYRKDKGYKKKLLEWAEKLALAPQEKNVYATGNEDFGLLALSISVGPDQFPPDYRRRLPPGINAGLTSCQRIFGDAVHSGAPFQIYTPSWLRIEPAEPDDSKKPPGKILYGKMQGLVSDAEALERNAQRLSKSSVESKTVDDIFLDLQVISQPPGTSRQDLQGNFWNFKKRGSEQLVYVIDSGCDMDHPEVSNIKFRKDWIFGGAGFPSDEEIDSADLFNYKHGTPAIGRVAGKHTGVAQDAEIVVVKVTDGRGPINHDTMLDVFVKVYDDIRKNSKRNCIVNFSVGWKDPIIQLSGSPDTKENLAEFGGRYNRLALDILEKFVELPNAILVVAVGNGEPGAPIDVYPARFGGFPQLQNGMVVVGGYDPETGLVSHNWADYVRVAAPAVSINVAAFYTDGELAVQLLGYIPQPTELQRKLQLETSEGTSFACPIVTGVIATLIGAGVPIAEVVPYLYNQAYPRVKGGPNAVYNGIEIKQWPQSLWPRWYLESLVTRTEPVKTILRDGTPLKTKYTTYLGEKSSTGTKTISVGGSAPKTLYTHFKRGTPSTSAPPLTR